MLFHCRKCCGLHFERTLCIREWKASSVAGSYAFFYDLPRSLSSGHLDRFDSDRPDGLAHHLYIYRDADRECSGKLFVA